MAPKIKAAVVEQFGKTLMLRQCERYERNLSPRRRGRGQGRYRAAAFICNQPGLRPTRKKAMWRLAWPSTSPRFEPRRIKLKDLIDSADRRGTPFPPNKDSKITTSNPNHLRFISERKSLGNSAMNSLSKTSETVRITKRFPRTDRSARRLGGVAQLGGTAQDRCIFACFTYR